MAMYNFQELAPNIFYFTNAISEPEKLVKFIEETEDDESINTNLISKWRLWKASNRPEDIYGLEKYITADYEKAGALPNARELYIINSIRSSMHFCATQYKLYNNVDGDVNLDKEFGIKKYNPGQTLGQHADQYDGNTKLRYSIVAYLNDNYEGGELSFSNQNVVIKPQAGSIAIFPSSEPYLHGSNELKSGNKYMAPGFWLW